MVSACKWQILATIQTFCNRQKMRSANARDKIFCIGLNKTGTTSWSQAMLDLGYVVGSETVATMFFYDWVDGDFRRIVNYCRTDGQVFQDFPFSLPNTYKAIDRAFPDCKFVLTVRDSADQWYESLINFHGKRWSPSGCIPPTGEDLAKTVYWKKGLLADYCREVFQTPSSDPYNREALLSFYQRYNQEIQNYFSERPSDLLVLNVGDSEAYGRLCAFLGFPQRGGDFPWKNKT